MFWHRNGSKAVRGQTMSFENVKVTTLDNGLVVITDPLPHVLSTTIGVWNPIGSRYETVLNNGAAHFLEHAVFKGTKKRDARRINTDIENIGGRQFASTNYELTKFYSCVTAPYSSVALDVAADVVLNPIFPTDGIEVERKVILEEIDMYADKPSIVTSDEARRIAYADQALGRPILGTHETVKGISRRQLTQFWNEYYNRSNYIVIASGNVQTDKIIDQANNLFKDKKKRSTHCVEAKFMPGYSYMPQKFNQTNFSIDFEGLSINHEKKDSIGLLADMMGGGFMSRLFQEVREKRGYAYSVYANISSYKDTGGFHIRGATNHKNIKECISAICDVIVKAGDQEPFVQEEIERSKKQIISDHVFSLETTKDRANLLAKMMIRHGKIIDSDTYIDNIEAIDAGMLNTLAREIFNKKPIVVACGLVGKMEDYDKVCNRLNIS